MRSEIHALRSSHTCELPAIVREVRLGQESGRGKASRRAEQRYCWQ